MLRKRIADKEEGKKVKRNHDTYHYKYLKKHLCNCDLLKDEKEKAACLKKKQKHDEKVMAKLDHARGVCKTIENPKERKRCERHRIKNHFGNDNAQDRMYEARVRGEIAAGYHDKRVEHLYKNNPILTKK